MPLNSGDGRGRSPEGRKSRFGGEERTSLSLQRGEHVTGTRSIRIAPDGYCCRLSRNHVTDGDEVAWTTRQKIASSAPV